MEKRKMTYEEAKERIHAQSAQAIKIKAADIVIQNNKSFEDTWKQVNSAWKVAVPVPSSEEDTVPTSKVLAGQFAVRRARPKEAQTIADFITRISSGSRRMNQNDVMAAFGEKAFLFLLYGNSIVGLLGWQVENLVARVDDLYLEALIPPLDAMKVMTREVEKASKELQCEAALLFLPPQLAQHQKIWQALDYTPKTVKELGVRAWQEAALESMPAGTVLMFKQLRVDRVLRPV
jgi:dephospho-CoA kinase